MKSAEYNRIPDEFNIGYDSSRNKKPEEEKRRGIYRILRIFVAVTLLIFPLTIRQGLISLLPKEEVIPDTPPVVDPVTPPEPIRYEINGSTYKADGIYVHFNEKNGWFYDGKYFIGFSWDEPTGNYSAAGSVPDNDAGSSLTSTVSYLRCEGTIESNEANDELIMYEPFGQNDKLFIRTEDKINDRFIDILNYENYLFAGYYEGKYVPDFGFDALYVNRIAADGSNMVMTIANTANTDLTEVSASYTYSGGVIIINLDTPFEYELTTEAGTKKYIFNDPLEAVVFVTEDGMYMGMNLFCWQVFELEN
ncbi:MAG: hypothetical protein IIY51_02215 [Erysipelotrichaceae bacterium]|nr:hypothetical protein [Erysipelotrichaceae bacterium]MBE6116577.1 hypothetical protein [Erysipelotrichaceae bacterium]MBQ1299966.1 hypothetical protein [Erysipelotrichaceae bacterium]MBQ1303701.1 hypothetical protein [Erysipelotrichaceae bacterium]